MFEDSYNKIVNSELKFLRFAKISEEYLYPIIDKAINDKKSMPNILALIASLPVESSRNRYLNILDKNCLSKQDVDFFISTFYNDDFYEIKNNLEQNIHTHTDEVISEFKSLLAKNDEYNIHQMSTDDSIYYSAKLIIIEHILDI